MQVRKCSDPPCSFQEEGIWQFHWKTGKLQKYDQKYLDELKEKKKKLQEDAAALARSEAEYKREWGAAIADQEKARPYYERYVQSYPPGEADSFEDWYVSVWTIKPPGWRPSDAE
jgi:hypothetical protein